MVGASVCMHKHKVVQQSHGTAQVAIVLRDNYRRDEQVPHSITPSGDGGCVIPFLLCEIGCVAVLVLPKERALISSVVTRLPPPPTASSGHPHSFFILPPAPPPHPSTGGTCPRHLLLYLNITLDASTRHVTTICPTLNHNNPAPLPSSSTMSASSRCSKTWTPAVSQTSER